MSSRSAFVARGTGFADPSTAAASDAREPSAGLGRGTGFGVLGRFVSEAGVSDVFVNPDGTVWCDRGRGAELAEGIRIPAGEARDLAVRLIALGGRHVDESKPYNCLHGQDSRAQSGHLRPR